MKAVCIKCWDADALVRMDLDGSGDFSCVECQETFSCEEVRATLEAMQSSWGRLIAWAESYPKQEAAA
jgi:hypothetical protein